MHREIWNLFAARKKKCNCRFKWIDMYSHAFRNDIMQPQSWFHCVNESQTWTHTHTHTYQLCLNASRMWTKLFNSVIKSLENKIETFQLPKSNRAGLNKLNLFCTGVQFTISIFFAFINVCTNVFCCIHCRALTDWLSFYSVKHLMRVQLNYLSVGYCLCCGKIIIYL